MKLEIKILLKNQIISMNHSFKNCVINYYFNLIKEYVNISDTLNSLHQL